MTRGPPLPLAILPVSDGGRLERTWPPQFRGGDLIPFFYRGGAGKARRECGCVREVCESVNSLATRTEHVRVCV